MTDAIDSRAATVDKGGYIQVAGWTLVVNRDGSLSFRFGGKDGNYFAGVERAQLALCAENLTRFLRSREGARMMDEARRPPR